MANNHQVSTQQSKSIAKFKSTQFIQEIWNINFWFFVFFKMFELHFPLAKCLFIVYKLLVNCVLVFLFSIDMFLFANPS